MQAEVNPQENRSSDHAEVAEFLDALRQLRVEAGRPSFRTMARTAHYSHTALSGAVSGGRLPSLELALAFVRACDGEEAQWRRRWHQVHESARASSSATHQPVGAESVRREPALRWLRPRWPVPMLRMRRRVTLAAAAVLAALVAMGVAGGAVLASRPAEQADPAACNPLPAGDPKIDHYVDQMRSMTESICARRLGVIGIRVTGERYLAGQKVFYYVQRNPDGYVQIQITAGAMTGHGEWSAYWQENPPDNPAHPGCSWYQQKIMDAGAALSWSSSGWLCAVTPSGLADPGGATAVPACNPLPADNMDVNEYINWLRSTTQPVCAAIPLRGGEPVQKLSSQTTGNTLIGAQSAFYRVQRNADGYVELQLIGPTTGSDPQPAWSVYWQANPPDSPARPGCSWYQERVEVRGQPTWQVNGWLCTAAA